MKLLTEYRLRGKSRYILVSQDPLAEGVESVTFPEFDGISAAVATGSIVVPAPPAGPKLCVYLSVRDDTWTGEPRHPHGLVDRPPPSVDGTVVCQGTVAFMNGFEVADDTTTIHSFTFEKPGLYVATVTFSLLPQAQSMNVVIDAHGRVPSHRHPQTISLAQLHYPRLLRPVQEVRERGMGTHEGATTDVPPTPGQDAHQEASPASQPGCPHVHGPAMRPLSELTLRRPWHWGIATLGDPLADEPIVLDRKPVARGRGAITLSVRHAQDIEGNGVGSDRAWATATIYLRWLCREEETERHILCDTIIATPSGKMTLGDADETLLIPAPGPVTRLIVSTDRVDPSGLDTVWVDLVAVDEQTQLHG